MEGREGKKRSDTGPSLNKKLLSITTFRSIQVGGRKRREKKKEKKDPSLSFGKENKKLLSQNPRSVLFFAYFGTPFWSIDVTVFRMVGWWMQEVVRIHCLLGQVSRLSARTRRWSEGIHYSPRLSTSFGYW